MTQTQLKDTVTSPQASPKPSWARKILARQETILLFVFIAMVVLFSAINPRYLSSAAAANILQDFAPVLLMAAGQTFVILTGGIDLSVGSVLGLSGVVTAMTARAANVAHMAPGPAILLAVASGVVVGLAVGVVNALLITRVRLAPFIATLATMGAVYGVTLVVTKGIQVAGGPKQVILLGNTTYLGLFTAPILCALFVTAVGWVWLAQTRFGRHTYAIGSNMFAARAAGINVRGHLLKVYVLSAVMASLAGVLLYFRLGSGAPSSGQGGELQSIAAAVIGGISLVGGVGRLGGTILGSLIITSVLSGLILIGVAPAWQQVVIGALIALAVALQGIGNSTRKVAL